MSASIPLPLKKQTLRWANQTDVVENPKHNGIELRFNATPSPLLQAKLRVKGFRPSKSQGMWYAEKTNQTFDFAKSVQQTLAHSFEGPHLNLSPSFEPSKTAIEKKDFSYVTISLKNGDAKNYVIFEASKPKAEILASNFAVVQFGNQLADLVVKPRTNVREARVLFNEQKVIQSTPTFPPPEDVTSKGTSYQNKEVLVKPFEPDMAIWKKEDETYPQPVEQPVDKKKVKNKRFNRLAQNQAIEALIDSSDRDKVEYSKADKELLQRYSGSGGLIKHGAEGRGILYEYYTSDIVIKKMWDLAYHYGYHGGKVLEPSVGTGNFLKYAPLGAEVVGFETNHYAARIAQILYPHAEIHEKPFETNFFAGNVHLKDNFHNTRYSLVIGNPPYGDFSGKYAGMGEKKFTGASQYEQYFTLRGLDLLEKDGLLVFILPSNFLKGLANQKMATKIADRCIGLDRYCLGEGVFKTTGIETDILVLKKTY
jgi:hypothetical protein